MNLGNIEIGILIPALLAGLLVLATHVPLGQQVLNRGIVFIDLAIAQVAGLGVTAADALGFEPQGWRVQAAAVLAALLGALVLTWTEKKWPEVQEALIGVLFVVAACVELLILANNPHGGEHLKDLLVGQFSGGKIRIFKNKGDGTYAAGEFLKTGEKVALVPGVW